MTLRIDLKRLGTVFVVLFFGMAAFPNALRAEQDDPSPPPPAPNSPSQPSQPTPPPPAPSRPSPSPGGVPPAADPEATPQLAPHRPGCATDRDCKGDRVCHAGRCAFPQDAARPASRPGPGEKAQDKKKKKKKKKIFSDRSTVEIGATTGFTYSRQKTNLEYENLDIKTKTKYYTFQLEFYLGYFVAPRFVLGLRLAFPYDKGKDGVGNELSSWGFELAFSPGIAVPVGGRVALYGDFLVGLATRKEKTKIAGTPDITSSEKKLMAQVGGEFGLKIMLGTSALMRIGFRPVYYTGEGEAKSGSAKFVGDASDFRFLVLLGFSAYHVSR